MEARGTGSEKKISPDIVQYRFDYPRARVTILNRDNVSISCKWRTHTTRTGHTSSWDFQCSNLEFVPSRRALGNNCQTHVSLDSMTESIHGRV